MTKSVTKLSFWGVRGSTPAADRSTWRYGGNTPCLELETPEGSRFILDCGTGLRVLGNQWLKTSPDESLEASIFVTHYHWDHIQGIPFFVPFYSKRNRFHFYSFRSKHLGPNSLRQVLQAQMADPYFPVDIGTMSATREFFEIGGDDQREINGTRITAWWLNHPQGCLGFRFETSAGTIVYATDNEPGVPELDANLRRLAEGADIFINDAQYTPEQLAGSRKGWGHSSWLEGVKVAREAGARNLVLFHHDPDSGDEIVDGLLQAARQRFLPVWAAAEGMVITLDGGRLEVASREPPAGDPRKMRFPATVTGFGEDGRLFEERTTVLELSFHGAELRLENRPRLQSEITVAIGDPGKESEPRARIFLRGFVVRREPDNDRTAITVIFTRETGSC